MTFERFITILFYLFGVIAFAVYILATCGADVTFL
jgi:hypothetical protein